MDKVIKLNSKQGGGFTATNNLIDFDIPPDGAYDLSRSYINLLCNVTDPDVTDAASVEWKPLTNSGEANYLAKYAAAVAGATPVLRPQISFAGAPNVPIYNAALVKNCTMDTERQGSLEDIRRVDILRQNLNEYVLTEEQKKSLEYSSLRQLADTNKQVGSIFTEVNSTGDNNSRALKTRVPIKLNQLFELGNVAKFPADKMGKVRMHLELNLDKMLVNYRNNFPKVGDFNYLNVIDADKTFFEAYRSPQPASAANKIITSANPLALEFPYYVGQLVRLCQAGTLAAVQSGQLVATATINNTNNSQTFTLANNGKAAPPATMFKAKFAVPAGALDAPLMVEITGELNGKVVSEEFQVAQDGTSPENKQLYDFISKIEKKSGVPGETKTIRVDVDTEIVIATRGVIADVTLTDAQLTQITFVNAIGNMQGLITANPAANIFIDTVGSVPTKADGTAGQGKLKVEMAELVLHKLGNPGKTPNKLQYMSYSTEQFTTPKQENFQRMFQLEPEAVNVLIMFPVGTEGVFSAMFDTAAATAAADRNVVKQFRLRLDNDDLMNRNVSPYDPLYYDRLNMTFMNMGYKLRNVHEWVSLAWLDPSLNPSTDTNTDQQSQAVHVGAIRQLIISNPVPATKQEKQLQVNIDCITGQGITNLAIFKQVMRSVGL